MGMTINTNVASLNAQRYLGQSQGMLNKSLSRLSSGLRINSAKDDAAGLAISTRMTAQIRGLNQAVRNANDGISLSQTAEGALTESTSILQRMRELGVQSINDTNSDSDRSNLQKEVIQLRSELDRIAGNTQFNGKNLLDGSFASQKFQVGTNANQTIQFSINSVKTTEMGKTNEYTLVSDGAITTATAASADFNASQHIVHENDDFTLATSRGSASVSITANMSAKAIAEAVNVYTSSTGVSARAVTYAKLSGFGCTGTVSFRVWGATYADITGTVTSSSTLTSIASSINNSSGSTGVTAVLSSDATSITLYSSEGYTIGIENFSGENGTSVSFTGIKSDGSTTTGSGSAAITYSTTPSSNTTDSSTVAGSVVFYSTGIDFTLSTQTTGGMFGTSGTRGTAYVSGDKVNSLDISTQSGANKALEIVDGALDYISNIRADLGSIQNRFQTTISNLQNVSENLSASRSRVLDADFASETAEMTKSQILIQAGTAMLAQANQLPQQVLALLG
jgi:flagellin